MGRRRAATDLVYPRWIWIAAAGVVALLIVGGAFALRTLMAQSSLLNSLEHELKLAITRLFGKEPISSSSYGRIVDPRHSDRLAALADGTTVIHGGQRDAATRYFAPTLLRPHRGDTLMQEEIFCPSFRWYRSAGRMRLSVLSTPAPNALPSMSSQPLMEPGSAYSDNNENQARKRAVSTVEQFSHQLLTR